MNYNISEVIKIWLITKQFRRDPDYMIKKFNELLKEHNLRPIRLHDLRHRCASNLLANGVPMKEIQEWLGHSNFSTTADVYSRLDFSAKITAAKTIASAYEEKP